MRKLGLVILSFFSFGESLILFLIDFNTYNAECPRFQREGYNEGLADGRQSGIREGMLLGIEHGGKLGSEVRQSKNIPVDFRE